MLTVGQVLDDIKRVLGGVDDETAYARLNDAVEILSTESDWDPLLGYVDVCVGCDRFATLPREVGTVLAVTINGEPALGHNWLFRFHANGPGTSFRTVGYHWVEGRPVATQLDPPADGLRLGATLESADDDGTPLRVFGYDADGNWIRSTEGGVIVDGVLVPTTYGVVTPTTSIVKRITRVSKPATAGIVKLFTISEDGQDLTQIAEYAPDELEPSYRRIQVSHPCSWVRVAFKNSSTTLAKAGDLIPLHSRYALVMMCKSLKKFDEDRIEEGEKYRQLSIDFLRKKQLSISVPEGPSIQIAQGNLLADKSDRLE